MRLVKMIVVLIFMSVAAGCATHAKIDIPVPEQVHKSEWQNKNFSVEFLYSQPEPGVANIFGKGKQQELKPLSESKLTISSAQVLRSFPSFLTSQLPANTKLSTPERADYKVLVEMWAHNSAGPTYPNYEAAKNFAKGMLTMGLGADEYDIIADFIVRYTLTSNGGKTFQKEFTVKESVDHERGSMEFKNNTFDYAAEMLKKHVLITSSAFLNEAATQL